MRFVIFNEVLTLSVSLNALENLLKGQMSMVYAPSGASCLVGMFGNKPDPRTTDPLLYGKVQALINIPYNDLLAFDTKASCIVPVDPSVDHLGQLVVAYEPALIDWASANNLRQITIDHFVPLTHQ